MNEEILINVTPQETRVALIQQGAVQELQDRKSTRLNSSHPPESRMPSSA